MKNLKIGVRLGTGFAIVFALMLALTGTTLVNMNKTDALTDRLVHISMKNQRDIAEWRRNIEVNSAMNEMVYLAADASIIETVAPRRSVITARSNVLQKEIEPALRNAAVREQFEVVKRDRVAYIEARDALYAAKQAGDAAAVEKIFRERVTPQTTAFLGSIGKFADLQIKGTDLIATSVFDTSASTRSVLIIVTLLALAAGTACAWFITRSIVAPLREAVAVAERVAGGDLTSRFNETSRDETGQLMAALGRMNGSLATIVGQVREGTATISQASGEIASGNQDLSARTEQQASSLEETAASMEELTSTVRQNTEHARHANGLAGEAANVAGEGGRMVREVVGTMGRIDASSQRIVDIIGVIDGIAFQTNILALNAAVEAARAGEQGRGFAVVASEVRTLAQRSSAAAKEIKGLIDDSVAQVKEGTRQVDVAGATMDRIVDSVAQVSTIIGEIAAASEEQSAGIDQVNTAVVEMDRVTQQNAALVEEAAAAAEAMREQASQLEAVVGTFRLQHGAPVQQAPRSTVRHALLESTV